MGSVCGQHDFIDLVGLDNAIFCGSKRVCVTAYYGNMHKYKHQGENILHHLAAAASREENNTQITQPVNTIMGLCWRCKIQHILREFVNHQIGTYPFITLSV